MTGEKFAEIVTNRANERVQKKLQLFREQIDVAFKNLTGTTYFDNEGKDEQGTNFKILDNAHKSLIKGNHYPFEHRKGWPSWLWRNEETAVTKELLSTMDEMQKALIASGIKQGDYTQESEEPNP